MSIVDEIARHEHEGRLQRWTPESRRPIQRCAFLTSEVRRQLTGGGKAIAAGVGEVYAALDRWTTGGLIYANADDEPGFMKRLKPPPEEIWEIRVTQPKKQLRVLCRFSSADHLVVTKVHTRDFLGKYGSAAWKEAMRGCEHQWKNLFKDIEPFRGTTCLDYITRNCENFKLS